jgi:brefeldin A-inhibited guanine nucleotide-exchange protein
LGAQADRLWDWHRVLCVAGLLCARFSLSVLVPADCDANKYFLPLKLACDTGQAKLVALALDCMEKLVAYGYLDGNCPAPEELYPSKKKDNATTTSTNAAAAPAAAAAAAVPVTPANASNTAGRSADASAASGATTASSTTAGGGPDGSSSTSSSTKPRRLIHVMMETLHECSMFKDALVQRQVLKALLTVVSSVSCPVHDRQWNTAAARAISSASPA